MKIETTVYLCDGDGCDSEVDNLDSDVVTDHGHRGKVITTFSNQMGSGGPFKDIHLCVHCKRTISDFIERVITPVTKTEGEALCQTNRTSPS